MEMHSQHSLHEIHGISASPRRWSRWRAMARLGIAEIFAVLKGMKKAIEAALAVRRANIELTSMDDRMLVDLGISRGEIRNATRRPRGSVGTDDRPVLPSDAGQHYLALPTINSPDLSSGGSARRDHYSSRSASAAANT